MVNPSARGIAWLAALWTFVGLLVAASVVQHEVPTASLYLDPAATSSARVWTGFFTELGLMFWVVAATAAAFVWAACSRSGQHRSEARLGMTAAALTTLLWLDDQFAMRNWVIPHVLGAPESAGEVIYLVLGTAWVTVNWRAIVRADRIVAAAAAAGLGFSEAVDVALSEQYTTSRTLLEEVPKLFGIVAWALFFILRFSRTLRGALPGSPGATGDRAMPAS